MNKALMGSKIFFVVVVKVVAVVVIVVVVLSLMIVRESTLFPPSWEPLDLSTKL